MFGKFAEQVKQSSKPISELVTVNTKALEAISKQQTAFLTGVLSDSVSFMQDATKQTKLNGLLAAQSVYSESVRDRFTTVSSDTLSTLTTARDDLSKVMKDSFAKSAAPETRAPATPKQTAAKPAPAKKPVAKAKPVAAKPVAPKKAAATKQPIEPVTAVEKPVKQTAAKATPKAKPAATTRKTTRKSTPKSTASKAQS